MSECDKIIKEFVDFSRCLILDSDPVEVSVDFVKEIMPSANKYTKEEIVDCFKKIQNCLEMAIKIFLL